MILHGKDIKICIRYFYSLVQKVDEFIHRNDDGISVLMFHNVVDKSENDDEPDITITRNSFIKCINGLKEKGGSFIDLQKEKAANLHNKCILLTFDDIFESAYLNAFPFLFENQIPFTAFISEEFVGKNRYITHKQLKQLSENSLCTIGFHSKSHALFRNLDNNSKIAELISTSLEKQIERKIDFFAFPYGSNYAVDRKSKCIAIGNYEKVFSTYCYKCIMSSFSSGNNVIPRININERNFGDFIKQYGD